MKKKSQTTIFNEFLSNLNSIVLDNNNLTWEKARRWGKLIYKKDGMVFYEWQNKIYVMEDKNE